MTLLLAGATLLGAANRVAEAFENVKIRAFVAMRTASNPSKFTAMYDPCKGLIEYREDSDDSLRRP